MVSLSKDVGFGVIARVEAENYIEAFKQLAMIEDCYDRVPDTVQNFRHRVREHDGNEYFELVGQTDDFKIRPTLALGVYNKSGSKGFLFPKRKQSEDKGGAWLDNNGWVVYNPSSKTEPAKNEKAATKKPRPKVEADEDTEF